jgi:hypothetical protein
MLFLIAPPALVAPPPPAADPAPALDRLQTLFDALPLALVEGRRGAMRGLLAKARGGWEEAKPTLRKSMADPDLTAIDRQVKAMAAMKPREQAAGALGIAITLGGRQARSLGQDVRQAKRTAMLAWCGVDDGQWNLLPKVALVFKPLLDQDQGRHPQVVQGLQGALDRFQEAQKKRQAPAAKQALKDLVDRAGDLEKP